MADDDTSITDVHYAHRTANATDEIELISDRQVEQAAQDLIRAAVEARRREFVEETPSEPGEDGVYRTQYLDTATGDYYVRQGDGTFVNTTTGQPVHGDPRDVDESEYGWVSWEFEYFHERSPTYPRTMAEQCRNAKAAIQSGAMTPIVGVGDTVGENWGGDASEHFKQFFLDPFVMNAVTNQQALLDELAVAMYAYEAVLKKGRLDARDVANQTIDLLDSIDGSGGGGSADLTLAVIGIAVGVVATVATAGSGTALTLGLIGHGVNAARVAVSASQQISGGTVDEIMEKLRTVLDDLRAGMDAEEEAIARSLEETQDSVDELLATERLEDMGTILPYEPNDTVTNVTSGTLPAPDEFRPRR